MNTKSLQCNTSPSSNQVNQVMNLLKTYFAFKSFSNTSPSDHVVDHRSYSGVQVVALVET